MSNACLKASVDTTNATSAYHYNGENWHMLITRKRGSNEKHISLTVSIPKILSLEFYGLRSDCFGTGSTPTVGSRLKDSCEI